MLEDGKVIMEIKVPGQYPQWMADILNKFRSHRSILSQKYGKAYLQTKERLSQCFKKISMLNQLFNSIYSSAEVKINPLALIFLNDRKLDFRDCFSQGI